MPSYDFYYTISWVSMNNHLLLSSAAREDTATWPSTIAWPSLHDITARASGIARV
jgi:hypothetical protein